MCKKYLGWDWKPPMQGIFVGWYDGPLLAIWIGFLCIDLSYTRLAGWAYGCWRTVYNWMHEEKVD